MLQNIVSYIKVNSESPGTVADELQQVKFMKSPAYLSNTVRYALMMRYTSLPAYRLLLEEFKLPSVSFLNKLTSGKIDSFASLKALQDNNCISEVVILIFDEIYLQMCEQYSGGESIGTDDKGGNYKGMVLLQLTSFELTFQNFRSRISKSWTLGAELVCFCIQGQSSSYLPSLQFKIIFLKRKVLQNFFTLLMCDRLSQTPK